MTLIQIGIVSGLVIIWLYVAARMVARGILRSIEEWKEKKENGRSR